jgi:hypothetical protein
MLQIYLSKAKNGYKKLIGSGLFCIVDPKKIQHSHFFEIFFFRIKTKQEEEKQTLSLLFKKCGHKWEAVEAVEAVEVVEAVESVEVVEASYWPPLVWQSGLKHVYGNN